MSNYCQTPQIFRFSSGQVEQTPGGSPVKSRLPVPISLGRCIKNGKTSLPPTPSRIPKLAQSLQNLSLAGMTPKKPLRTTSPSKSNGPAPTKITRTPSCATPQKRVVIGYTPTTPRKGVLVKKANVPPLAMRTGGPQTPGKQQVEAINVASPTPLSRKIKPVSRTRPGLSQLKIEQSFEFTYHTKIQAPIMPSPERAKIDYTTIPRILTVVNGVKRSSGFDERFPILKRVKKQKLEAPEE